jgi:hypothetical protein
MGWADGDQNRIGNVSDLDGYNAGPPVCLSCLTGGGRVIVDSRASYEEPSHEKSGLQRSSFQ